MQVYVIEAHPDDAALSIGGLLLNLSANDQTSAITVFTIFDGSWAKRTFGKNLVIKNVRRLENEKALNIANAKNICLGFLEAYDRGYRSYRRVSIPIKERDLVTKVSLSLKQMLAVGKRGLVLFPIAVGHHVDHLIAFESMIRLCRERALRAEQTRLYEDCPYVCRNKNDLNKRLGIIRQNYFQVKPLVIDITTNATLKTEMLKSYSSQFGYETIRIVKTYSSKLGKQVNKGSQLFFERIWVPNSSVEKKEA